MVKIACEASFVRHSAGGSYTAKLWLCCQWKFSLSAVGGGDAVAWRVNGWVKYVLGEEIERHNGARGLATDDQFLRAVQAANALPVFWTAAPNGEWAQDVKQGQALGAAYLAALNDGTAPPLGWVLRDMIRQGQYTGVEAGFAYAIAAAVQLRAGAADNHG